VLLGVFPAGGLMRPGRRSSLRGPGLAKEVEAKARVPYFPPWAICVNVGPAPGFHPQARLGWAWVR
jgi:hypothetical protein